MLYYDAMKHAFHEMLNARDFYLLYANTIQREPNPKLLNYYIHIQAQILNPVTPHFSEFVWRDCLNHPEFIEDVPWPQLEPEDEIFLAQKSYLERTLREIRLQQKPKPKTIQKVSNTPNELGIYVATNRPEWQQSVLESLRHLVGFRLLRILLILFHKSCRNQTI